jgi:hypothetical protein
MRAITSLAATGEWIIDLETACPFRLKSHNSQRMSAERYQD